MLQKSKAILLKKIKYGEKNLILQTFTRENGPQSFFLGSSLIKGKSKINLSALGIYSIVANKGKGELFRITEMSLAEKHFNLISNIRRSSVLMFLNEILLKVLKENDSDEELFDFISASLSMFNNDEEDNVNFHLKFLLELTRHLGFYPNGQYSKECTFFNLFEGQFEPNLPVNNKFIEPALSERFSELLELDIEDTAQFHLINADRRSLLSHILEYYRIHIEGFGEIKSIDVLETVLS